MEENNVQQTAVKVKKPIYKKWWFWVIIAVIAVAVIGAAGGGDSGTETPSNSGSSAQYSNTTQSEAKQEEKKDKLELLEHSIVKENYTRKIKGKIRNNTSREYSYAQIEFALYDEDGALVGSTFTNINNLEAGGIWKFEAVVFEDEAVTYKVKEITGW